MRILIVDDSIVIVKMTSTLLQRQGHLVYTASNGLEGVTTIRQSLEGELPPIDVVLMDFQMPVMGGVEAIREIRMLERSVPVSEARLKDDALERFNRSKLDHNSGKYVLKSPKNLRRATSAVSRDSNEDISIVSFEDENSRRSISYSKAKSPKSNRAIANSLVAAANSNKVNQSFFSSSSRRYVRHYIIGFSAKSDPHLTSEAYTAGIDAFMPKPFTVQSFNEIMMKLISSSGLTTSSITSTKVTKHDAGGIEFRRF